MLRAFWTYWLLQKREVEVNRFWIKSPIMSPFPTYTIHGDVCLKGFLSPLIVDSGQLSGRWGNAYAARLPLASICIPGLSWIVGVACGVFAFDYLFQCVSVSVCDIVECPPKKSYFERKINLFLENVFCFVLLFC